MPAREPEKMRSVNVKMTDAMIKKIEARGPNRSETIRHVLAAILAARRDGVPAPFESAIEAAIRSSSRTLRLTMTSNVDWRKAIVWLPERMHREIEKECRDLDVRPADFIRGAIIGATGDDPARDIIKEGHEIWSSQVVDEAPTSATGS
ncbi:hypothetical protein [Defluviimonas salinarum]|uniref:Ribbon-helix-helix protein CopG domain-containing protein n=1 Tax=Defluviimonas salinarum TaxID=2992147 RepID=A0ABT3J4I1_9RHOB|nr:hypothetical protein [Defluviimonas salinarum]MCW3782599.1 hypothetical protein [Defluviimonas salinarum]